MGAVSLITLINYRYRNYLIFQLHRELNKNIESILKKGENENTEFKSSFRYDYKQQKVNKALESVIVKTVAGFMNTMGGSLLIGVADDGSILGLEPDYNSLARKDSDGFTQLITSTISDKLGTPACRLLRIQFHQLNNKEICRIIVMPSPLPVYAREDKMTRFYVRTASGTREMDVDEAVAFIKMKWG